MQITIQVSDNFYDDVKLFCQHNNLNQEEFLTKILKQGYYVEKYGILVPSNYKPEVTQLIAVEDLPPTKVNDKENLKKKELDIYGE